MFPPPRSSLFSLLTFYAWVVLCGLTSISPAQQRSDVPATKPAAARTPKPAPPPLAELPVLKLPPAGTPAGTSAPRAPAAGAETTPVPGLGIDDEGTLFSPEESASLVAGIAAFQKQTGIKFWLVTRTYIFGETAESLRQRLVNTWAGESSGIVVLYDRSTNNLGYSATAPTGPEETLRTLFRGGDRSQQILPAGTPIAVRLRTAVETLLRTVTDWKQSGALPAISDAGAVPSTHGPAPPNRTDELPGPPATRIMDEASILTDEVEKSLGDEIDALFKITGVSVFIMTRSYLDKGTADEFSRRLAAKWLGEELGAVLVYDRSATDGQSEKGLGISVISHPERWIAP